MGRYEDLIDLVREHGLEDVADGLDEFRATRLREQAGKATALEEENAKLRGQIEEMVLLPRKEQAFKDAGVDFAVLRPAERDLIRRLKPEGDDLRGWVEKTIEQYELPVGEVAADEEDTSGAAKVAQAARQAPSGLGRKAAAITPEVVETWDVRTRLAFKAKYPDAWELLLDGKEVSGIVFP